MQRGPRLVFFIGAGFAKANLKVLPLARDLMGLVLAELADTDDPAFPSELHHELEVAVSTVFPHLKGRESSGDLERFMSVLHELSSAGYESLRKELLGSIDSERLWRGIVAALGRIFAPDFPPYSDPPVRRLVEIFSACREHAKRFSIVTTNYDLTADKAKGVVHDQVRYPERPDPWKPMTEDLARYRYGFEVRGLWRMDSQELLTDYGNAVSEWPIYLYKLHGSVNWAYCATCKRVDLSSHGGELLSVYWTGRVKCRGRDCSGDYEWLLVPPIPAKEYSRYPPLLEVWRGAEEVLSDATRVVFIGYSLPRADPAVESLLLRARARAAQNHGEGWRYWVFDPNWSVHERFYESFGDGIHYGEFIPEVFQRDHLPTILA